MEERVSLVVVSAKVPMQARDELRQLAESRGITVSALAARILSKYLDKRRKKGRISDGVSELDSSPPN